jgi:hypothetical protein
MMLQRQVLRDYEVKCGRQLLEIWLIAKPVVRKEEKRYVLERRRKSECATQ